MSSPRILITGATGFIGSEVLARLAKRVTPESIYLLGRRKPDLEKGLFADRWHAHKLGADLLERMHFVTADFTKPAEFRTALETLSTERKSPWVIIHMAALIHAKGDRETQERVNLGVTRDLLDWLNPRGGHFVFTSSVVAFGGTVDAQVRSEKDFAQFPAASLGFDYYTTKRAAHQMVIELAQVPVTLLCPGIVHGHLEHYKDSRNHLKALREGRLSLAPSGGAGIVGLDRVAEAIVEAALQETPQGAQSRLLVEKNWSYCEYFQFYVNLARGDAAQRIRRVPTRVGALARSLGVMLARAGYHVSILEGLGQGSLYTYFQSEQSLPPGLPVEESLRISLQNDQLRNI